MIYLLANPIAGRGRALHYAEQAVHVFKEHGKKAEIFYQRKLAVSKNKALAIKALSSKLARASYHIMRDDVIFDEDKLFA